ncbi:MAG: PspC domain-containing protein [Anaerolineales bacterium]|nr:PspC domain-containing protein [Anaerolineales bacterium]
MSGEVRRLYRSTEDRWLAGVCGGIGEYFSLDPTIVRLLFILIAFAFGGGILVYLLLWLIIPENPGVALPPEDVPAEESE